MQNLISKLKAKLYYFQETILFVWKIQNFDELQHEHEHEFLLKFCTNFLFNNF